MKRIIAFHPVLFAAYPVLLLYGSNLTLIPGTEVWRPLGIAVGFAALVWAMASLVFRDLSRGAAIASAAVAAIYLFAPAWSRVGSFPFLNSWNCFIWAWVILWAVVAGVFVWRKVSPTFLNAFSGLMVLQVLGVIAVGLYRVNTAVHPLSEAVAAGTTVTTRPPDIFYIIVDGYGRADQIKRVMGYDNTPFIKALEDRGFYVAKDSHSNYCQTELSVSSSLNFDTLPHLFPSVSSSETDRTPFQFAISDNRLVKELRARGYAFLSVTTGFPSIQFPHADQTFSKKVGVSLLEETLLGQMTVDGDSNITMPLLFMKREQLLDAFENAKLLATKTAVPRFVFMHFLAPHPSFVFNADGSRAKPDGSTPGLCDGSDYMEHGGTAAKYRHGYSQQLQWLNGKLLEWADTVLSQPGEKPIIIIQGDHGSKLGLDQNVLAKTDLNECFSNLSTFYVPNKIQQELYSTVTPVNSFRIILHSLFDMELSPLPDRSYYSPYSHPMELTDVTDRLLQGARNGKLGRAEATRVPG